MLLSPLCLTCQQKLHEPLPSFGETEESQKCGLIETMVRPPRTTDINRATISHKKTKQKQQQKQACDWGENFRIC